ncbi:hypothetical protein [Bdellovibrio sp.]|uniref:hypothetical protein n=1 Tax=Bdellovibrio TaxID=958 RepID=UPI003221FD0F
MRKTVASKAIMMASAMALIAGCSKGTGSYSLLDDGADYKQQAVFIPKQIDILWVIDNSGSMETSQTNLTQNFASFISRFQTYNYDFNMAVTTTEAWRKQFDSNSTLARIKDGAGTNHSGVFVMNKNTQNLGDVFAINAKQGINGNGDERALSSIKETLLDAHNNTLGFRRPEAFLAVIIVTDEEDFSSSSGQFNESYSNPNLHTVQSYVDFMDQYVGSRNYSVNTIGILDDACRTSLNNTFKERKIASRLIEMSNLTGGVKASLCSNFGESLELISDSIIQLSSVFKLNREPQEDTIAITVNGASVPNDPVNGWTYDASNLTITFHGSAVPAADANITIDFYPKSIKL